MEPDRKLSDHFGFYELTITSNAALQERNREVAPEDAGKPEALARYAEIPRGILGGPMRVHSGYRCPELNGQTPGSAKTSQHMKWEAIDFDEPGVAVEETFRKLLEAARARKFQFGQLILEEAADRFGGVVKWVHVSMIGTLDPAKVGQVLTKKDGADGQPVWTLIEQIQFVWGIK